MSSVTSASCNTTSAWPSRRAPRTVIRSAAPGPAPIRKTLPMGSVIRADHAGGDCLMCDFVDQDESTGGADGFVAVGGDGVLHIDRPTGDVVEFERFGGA